MQRTLTVAFFSTILRRKNNEVCVISGSNWLAEISSN